MNERSNESQGISGRAVATTLGLGGGIALAGAGLLMGKKAFSPSASTLKKGTKATARNIRKASNVKGTQSDYLKKHYKEMVKSLKR